MTLKQTSVIIDVEKWDTLKGRGYKLQDIVDTAFNNLLDINLTDNLELNKEKDNLKNKKMYLLQDLESVEKEYTKKMDTIKNEIKDIDFKIKEIEKTISLNEKTAEEEKKLSEEKIAKLREHNIIFNDILNRFLDHVNKNPEGLRMDFFNNDSKSKDYCNKYGMTLETLSDIIYKKQLGMEDKLTLENGFYEIVD